MPAPTLCLLLPVFKRQLCVFCLLGRMLENGGAAFVSMNSASAIGSSNTAIQHSTKLTGMSLCFYHLLLYLTATFLPSVHYTITAIISAHRERKIWHASACYYPFCAASLFPMLLSISYGNSSKAYSTLLQGYGTWCKRWNNGIVHFALLLVSGLIEQCATIVRYEHLNAETENFLPFCLPQSPYNMLPPLPALVSAEKDSSSKTSGSSWVPSARGICCICIS